MLLPTQLGYHFWPDFTSVLGLRIDYLSPTVYLTDILVLMMLGLWVFEKFKIKNEPSSRPSARAFGPSSCRGAQVESAQVEGKFKIEIKNFKLIIFFLGFFLLNCLLAKNGGAAVYKLVKLIELGLLGIYVAETQDARRKTQDALFWAVIYSSLIAIAQFFKQASLGGVFWWLGERTFNSVTPGIAQVEFLGRQLLRPYGTFSHPNSLSGFLLVSGIVVAQFTARQKARTKVRDYIFSFFFFLLTLLTIFLTFSRAVWIGGGLVVGCGLWVVGRRKLGILGILGSLGLGGLGILGRFEGSLSFQRRVVLNRASWEMMKSFPLGVGLNNFIPRLPEFWRSVEAIRFLQPVHNIYLLAGAELGILGLLGFLGFLGKTILKVYREKRFSILYSLFSILLLGLFDHYWLTLQQNQLLLAIILGLAWQKREVKLVLIHGKLWTRLNGQMVK